MQSSEWFHLFFPFKDLLFCVWLESTIHYLRYLIKLQIESSDSLIYNHMKMWISIYYVHSMYTIPRDNQNKQQMRKAGRGTHIRTNLNNWHMRRPFLHSKQLDVLHFNYLRVWMISNYIINTANLYVHGCINEGVFCMLLRQFIFSWSISFHRFFCG